MKLFLEGQTVNIMRIFYKSRCKTFYFIYVHEKWSGKLFLRKYQPENVLAFFSAVLEALMTITRDADVNLNYEDRCRHHFRLNIIVNIL